MVFNNKFIFLIHCELFKGKAGALFSYTKIYFNFLKIFIKTLLIQTIMQEPNTVRTIEMLEQCCDIDPVQNIRSRHCRMAMSKAKV